MENKIDGVITDREELANKIKAAFKEMHRIDRAILVRNIQEALGGQSYFSVYQKILRKKWPNRQAEIAWREVENMKVVAK